MYQAVLETVARVKPKKNDSKEEKYAPFSCRIKWIVVVFFKREPFKNLMQAP